MMRRLGISSAGLALAAAISMAIVARPHPTRIRRRETPSGGTTCPPYSGTSTSPWSFHPRSLFGTWASTTYRRRRVLAGVSAWLVSGIALFLLSVLIWRLRLTHTALYPLSTLAARATRGTTIADSAPVTKAKHASCATGGNAVDIPAATIARKKRELLLEFPPRLLRLNARPATIPIGIANKPARPEFHPTFMDT